MAPTWVQNGTKTAQESSLGALRRPFGNHVGLLHFFWHFLMPFWSPFWTFLAPFLEQKTMRKSRWKSMPKNIEKWCQKCAKMMPKWTQNQFKNRLFRERWFCKKPCFSLGKTYFLRFRGSKNLWKVDQKTMRKRASKKWCKIDWRRRATPPHP